ncbi:DMT family transporter [Candidatus Marinarcus aquaticus]|uniref:EamA family transporter n=1 Tax=Candidatus Marinarcus aquaticus TaxID=2044504 RepID=A0A4V1LP59_9BACT|nr:DMT family transporter [Candidatus Marinarcus aquaticus]RXJ60058.1 EamA family transporter [Candidatus Marinarcus aquaticus]
MSHLTSHRFYLLCVTILSLIFLAANSVLCKLAFKDTGIDPFSFTSIRLLSGAITLFILVQIFSNQTQKPKKNFLASLMLFVYAITFSYSYVLIDTGVGALILFGVVQVVMISYAFFTKQQLNRFKLIGACIAFLGLIYLLSPSQKSQISFEGALLMALSGVAWGVYSIVGKNIQSPLITTSQNFTWSLLFIILFSFISTLNITITTDAFIYALISGAITSGLGYVLWYMVVKKIETSTASILQLLVPVLATLGGVIFLQEQLTFHFITAAIIILSGITLSAVKKLPTI